MRSSLLLLAALLASSLAGCGTTTPDTDITPPPTGPPALCPDDLAERLRPVYGLTMADNSRALFLHLHLSKEEVAWVDGSPLTFTPVDDALAASLGLTPSSDPVWVLSGGAPCRLEARDVVRMELDFGGPRYATFVQRLEGECPVGDGSWGLPGWGIQAPAAPDGCHFLPGVAVKDEHATPVPMPPDALGALDPSTCKEPGCFQIRDARLAAVPDGPALAEMHASRFLGTSRNEPDCDSAQVIHAIWLMPRPGAAWVSIPVHYTSAVANAGLLYDASGARAVLTEFLSIWALYDTTGKPLFEDDAWAAHRYAIHHEEDGADEIYPCGL